ncbi:hypothetical protein NL676_013739 [Syzygium grande]|nr:hypothetical protein NL676_013739 [Syzygium grande]
MATALSPVGRWRWMGEVAGKPRQNREGSPNPLPNLARVVGRHPNLGETWAGRPLPNWGNARRLSLDLVEIGRVCLPKSNWILSSNRCPLRPLLSPPPAQEQPTRPSIPTSAVTYARPRATESRALTATSLIFFIFFVGNEEDNAGATGNLHCKPNNIKNHKQLKNLETQTTKKTRKNKGGDGQSSGPSYSWVGRRRPWRSEVTDVRAQDPTALGRAKVTVEGGTGGPGRLALRWE